MTYDKECYRNETIPTQVRPQKADLSSIKFTASLRSLWQMQRGYIMFLTENHSQLLRSPKGLGFFTISVKIAYEKKTKYNLRQKQM